MFLVNLREPRKTMLDDGSLIYICILRFIDESCWLDGPKEQRVYDL